MRWISKREMRRELEHYKRVAQTEFRIDMWIFDPVPEAWDVEPFDMHGHVEIVWRCTLHDLYLMAKYGEYAKELYDLRGDWIGAPLRLIVTTP